MSKRLQVVMSDSELAAFERLARGKGMTLSDWVRETLRERRRSEPKRAPETKLSAIRSAVQHSFPAPDIEQMLAETARGYGNLPE
jgi:hypothetical protein